ncbi:MAG TPA: SH3 domain-containing protein [Oligoflexia bacterium]|nr:SH3 domain-containing protein [Oligoflexia bacterium]HMP49207.1 SH3 domain-containing protein [Oligoflexia bacterium]
MDKKTKLNFCYPIRTTSFFLFFALFYVFNLFSFSANTVMADSVSVSVRETQLRSKEDFLSKGTPLKYGDSLKVLSKNNGWIKVKSVSGKEGFVHSSSVTDRELNLVADKKMGRSGASSKEVVLASKGFDKDVESKYAASNRALNFSAVNQMERTKISQAEISSFIKEGKLGGGAS